MFFRWHIRSSSSICHVTTWAQNMYCEGRFPIGILGQVWCLIVSIPDRCPLSYFEMKTYYHNCRSQAPRSVHLQVTGTI